MSALGTLIAQGELGATPLHIRADDTASLASDGSLEMRTGDLVLIGRNDNRLGVCNGTCGVVTAVDVEADSLTLRTDDEREVTVGSGWPAGHHLSHAYAMTVHKAQGLTVDHALLYGSEALTLEAGYVGLSRGRRENHIYLNLDHGQPFGFLRDASSSRRRCLSLRHTMRCEGRQLLFAGDSERGRAGR